MQNYEVTKLCQMVDGDPGQTFGGPVPPKFGGPKTSISACFWTSCEFIAECANERILKIGQYRSNYDKIFVANFFLYRTIIRR